MRVLRKFLVAMLVAVLSVCSLPAVSFANSDDGASELTTNDDILEDSLDGERAQEPADVLNEPVETDDDSVVQEEGGQRVDAEEAVGNTASKKTPQNANRLPDKQETKDIQEQYSVQYRAHVQTYGWRGWVSDGETAGTTGQSKRVEALQIRISNEQMSGSVQYRAHVQTYGWQRWVSDGETAGTTGQSKRVEAVSIRLTGQLSENYDVWYRAHVQTYGWLGWTKNGNNAGTTGLSKRVESLQIVLAPKGEGAPGSTANPLIGKASVSYSAHINKSGWQGYKKDGSTAGKASKSTRIEALRVKYSSGVGGSIQYRAYVQTYGWQGWVSDGKNAGTTGQSKRVEAVQIKLTGTAAKYYDIWYRVYAQDHGWLGWAKNGASAGTSSISYKMGAIQIRITAKGASAPGSTAKPYTSKKAYSGTQLSMYNKAQSYSSGTKYLILVNRKAHKVGVFTGKKGNWSYKYYWSCVTGASGSPTITGTFRSSGYKKTVLSTDSRAKWCTQISGGYFFHTILASESELGKSLSHGCVRLAKSNAKWIYNNIRSGTTIVIYS